MKSLVILLALIVGINCYESYRNYKLYDVTPTADQYEAFAAWEYETGVDFFKLKAAGRNSKVLIAPERQNDFEIFLTRNGIAHYVIYEDYEVEIEKERANMAETRKTKRGFSTIDGHADFSVYWTFAEMEAYSAHLANSFPAFVTKDTLAFSPEGRRIFAMKVSSGVFGQKPIIAMETGMHAREWATPPTTFYLLHKLIEDPVTRAELLANVDWLIVPMQNPDGYEHSRLVARLWRQNRRQITPTCIGADLNRNFEFSWRAATATQLCGSLTYPGPFAFSEPEDFHLHEVVSRYRGQVKMYLSVHTFGDLVLFPWGYRDAPGPIENYDELERVGNIWRDAILAATGKDYLVVNSLDYFGNINGAVDDHMVGVNDASITYTLELTDGHDFRYPEDRVLALVEETLIGYRAFAHYIGSRFG